MLIDPGHWYSKMGRKGWDEAPDILGLNVSYSVAWVGRRGKDYADKK